MYKVAIVGMGIVSSLGSDAASVTESLQNGISGVVVDPKRIEMGFRSPLTGKIKGFTPPDIKKKNIEDADRRSDTGLFRVAFGHRPGGMERGTRRQSPDGNDHRQ